MGYRGFDLEQKTLMVDKFIRNGIVTN